MLRKLMLVSLAVGGVLTLGICIPFDAAGQGSGGGILPPGGETLQGGAITLEALAELDSANSVIDQRLRLLRTTGPFRPEFPVARTGSRLDHP